MCTHEAPLRCRWCQVVWENVRCLENGETVSLAGTHLGHNIPDKNGNRCVYDLRCGLCASDVSFNLISTNLRAHTHHMVISPSFHHKHEPSSLCPAHNRARAATASTSCAWPEALEAPPRRRKRRLSNRSMTPWIEAG